MVDAATESSLELETILAGVDAEAWAPGSSLVAVGADEAGADTVAVWQLSPLAVPTGAWLFSFPALVGSRAEARRALTLVRSVGKHDLPIPNRITDWDTDEITHG
ncbi:DUF6218 family protein [Prauserella oleivorans]|uniref:DUF6218 family protein n=1 Tax=Prauserella oleivorans TaxID=1478153 RepID=A0ABW5WBC3_9PSEU